ncbi:hypothetical protein KI688_008976 [Linnemannia hyalina]|uniref:Uncharacterized protein n=1 Tax=Linnemannia hyalina TaxID=64524 RepID=A0A9P8BUR3_9FUNG|nr:hypothetical protein KI688_008971 [Linnemannia hyalina]KAG9069654.1 hypothetical protein KI688_008976 [Linnemannia hyalina]
MASWSHFMMMRGENNRFAKLPHINFHAFSDLNSPIMMKNSDQPRTFATVLVMTQGKTLRSGGVTYGVSIRNVDVTNCFAGARSDMRAFIQEIKSTMDSNFQLLEKTISAKIGNAMEQQSNSLKDSLSITLNQHNLAFSRTTQRVYQEK